jgi:hypothetical protein
MVVGVSMERHSHVFSALRACRVCLEGCQSRRYHHALADRRGCVHNTLRHTVQRLFPIACDHLAGE